MDLLAHEGRNLEVLRRALGDWVERHLRTRSDHAVRRGTIDIDSFPQEVCGAQAGAAWHGHYQAKIYHPLVASFAVGGDYDNAWQGGRLGNGFIHAILRRGNAHTAEGMLRFLERVLELAPRLAYVFDLRLDAGMTGGRVLDYLTRQKVRFLGRLKSNPVLDALAEPHLKRPPGRPPQGGYETVVELGPYQAASWKFPQRLLLVVIDDPDPKTGQLFLEPDYFFLVSGWTEEEMDGAASLEHYRRRGTFEDRLGEFNQALGIQLSSPEFRENEATLVAGPAGVQPRQSVADRVGGQVGRLLGPGAVSRLRAEGRRSGDQAFATAAGASGAGGGRFLAASVLQRIAGWHLAPRFPLPRAPTVRLWRPPPRHAYLSEVLRD